MRCEIFFTSSKSYRFPTNIWHCPTLCRILLSRTVSYPLKRRHNGRDSVSNHQPHDCLLNRLFRRRTKKTSKLHVTGLCAGNSPMTGEFPAQMARNAENVSIWWRHHVSDAMLPAEEFAVTLDMFYGSEASRISNAASDGYDGCRSIPSGHMT